MEKQSFWERDRDWSIASADAHEAAAKGVSADALAACERRLSLAVAARDESAATEAEWHLAMAEAFRATAGGR